MLKELLFAAKQLEWSSTSSRSPTRRPASPRRRYVMTAIGPRWGRRTCTSPRRSPPRGQHRKIGRLSENTLASVEIHASSRRTRTARGCGPAPRGDHHGFDVSLQPEAFPALKRLIVIDMDSTLIRIEVIDELARAAGVGPRGLAHHRARHAGGDGLRRVAAPARRAARGPRREGARPDRLESPLTEGAETLVRC